MGRCWRMRCCASGFGRRFPNGSSRVIFPRAADNASLDSQTAPLCFLSRSIPQLCFAKKLVQGLCVEKNVPLVDVPDNKSLGEWAGLCKIDKTACRGRWSARVVCA